jgi:hypothetical protein
MILPTEVIRLQAVRTSFSFSERGTDASESGGAGSFIGF